MGLLANGEWGKRKRVKKRRQLEVKVTLILNMNGCCVFKDVSSRQESCHT